MSIVLVYAVFASLWILLSDRLVQMIFSEPEQIILASMFKGWLFVGVTSLLLYFLMRRWGGDIATFEATSPVSCRLNLPFLLLVGVIIALTGVSINYSLVVHKETEFARLQAIADLKTRQISDWLRERQSDADFVMSSDFFAEQYRRWQKSGELYSGERLQTRLKQISQNRKFDSVMLLNPKGEQLWRSDKSPLTAAPLLQAAVRLASAERKTQRVGPYRDTAGKVHLDFVVPLTAISGPVPLVVLQIDLANWFFSILQTWPVPSATGETLMFRADDGQVLYLNDLRHQKDAAVKLSLTATTKKLLAAQVLRNKVLLGRPIEGMDYRGIPVIGVVRAISGSDWFLVAKMDQTELYAKVCKGAAWIGFTGLLALITAIAVFYLLRQRQQLALAIAIQQSQAERLSALRLLAAIAESSDDAIFAKDLEGRYILFNRAASRFVGKPVDEVQGHDDRAIFPPEQANMLMAFDRRVIAENSTLTQEEVLNTPEGERVFLATKGTLRDDNGNVTGLFGISRDITDIRTTMTELQRRNDELERFNRATVGRELDMIALKQQINALSCQLGREPPYPLSFLDTLSTQPQKGEK